MKVKFILDDSGYSVGYSTYGDLEDVEYDIIIDDSNPSEVEALGMKSQFYHIVDGKGIYKFEPNNESFSCVYKSSDVLSSFNIRGDYFYFVNESDNALYKVTKSGKNLSKVADGISLAYIYDSTAYCISADNSIVTVNTQDFSRNVLYSAYGNTLGFIGISKDIENAPHIVDGFASTPVPYPSGINQRIECFLPIPIRLATHRTIVCFRQAVMQKNLGLIL